MVSGLSLRKTFSFAEMKPTSISLALKSVESTLFKAEEGFQREAYVLQSGDSEFDSLGLVKLGLGLGLLLELLLEEIDRFLFLNASRSRLVTVEMPRGVDFVEKRAFFRVDGAKDHLFAGVEFREGEGRAYPRRGDG